VRVRLLPEALTLVAQWTERCSATAEVAGSTPAERMCGRSSVGRAPGRHPGEARATRVARSRFEGPWCNGARRAPTSPVRVRLLADLPHSGLLAGRSGSVISSVERPQAVRFDSACPTASHDRETFCCRPERCRLSPPTQQGAGSIPARSLGFGFGSSVVEQFRSVLTRPQQSQQPRAGEVTVISQPGAAGRLRTLRRQGPVAATAVLSGCGPE
jgi:hypothetical protein